MTVQQALDSAMAQLFTSTQDYAEPKEYAVNWVNLWLIEALPYENSIRAAAGVDELPSAPVLTSLSDEVPYAAVLVGTSLVYYFAALLEKENDHNTWAIEFRNRSISALDDYKKATRTRARDVYWGAGE